MNMKKFNIAILLLSALCLFATSCVKGGVDDLTGVYDMDRYNFTTGTVGTTEVQDDLIILNVTVSDGSNTLAIKFGSATYALRTTTYTLATELTASGQYTATINGTAVTYGDLDVTLIGDRYYLTAYMKDSTGRAFIAKYIGGLTFSDPTAGSDDGTED